MCGICSFEWGVFVFVFGSRCKHTKNQNQTFELKNMKLSLKASESGMKWCDGVSSASCAVSPLIFLSSVQVGLASRQRLGLVPGKAKQEAGVQEGNLVTNWATGGQGGNITGQSGEAGV